MHIRSLLLSCVTSVLLATPAFAGEAQDKIYVNGQYFDTVPSGTDTCEYVRRRFDTDQCHYIRQERVNYSVVRQYVRIPSHLLRDENYDDRSYPGRDRRGINIYIQF